LSCSGVRLPYDANSKLRKRSEGLSLFFRPHASRIEKAYTIFIYVSIAAFFYGFFSNISPTEFVTETWVYLTLALTLLYFVPLLFARLYNVAPASLPRRVLGYFFLFLLLFGLASYLTFYSIPSIFTALMGQPYEFRAVVEAKHESFNARECTHKIELKDFGYGIHENVCVDSSIWELIEEGDTVHVDSSKSALGIKINDINTER
jgi:hypothetical protein